MPRYSAPAATFIALLVNLLEGPKLQKWPVSALFLAPRVRGDDTTTRTPSGGVYGTMHERAGTQRGGVFQGKILEDVNQQLQQTQDDAAVAIRITRPSNDAVFFVGDMVLEFETQGFTSEEFPIEVLIPQNGDTPALLKKGNSFTLEADLPCTLLVTLSATVFGRRVSTSVLFSTIQDKETIASSRAPLPVDAVWGLRPEVGASRLDETEADQNFRRRDTDTARESRLDVVVTGGLEAPQRLEKDAGRGGPPDPISLVFVGSLKFDGQKHIWLQQMERLPRARFSPKYLTFQQEKHSGTGVAAEGASAWKTEAAENFERQLRQAGVPLVKAILPQIDASSISHGSDAEISTSALRETALRAVIDSIDNAGDRPRPTSPPWAREFVRVIADAFESVAPDVLVFANDKTLGDVALTRAARWAMGARGCKIVMEFPNVDPVQGVDVDVLVTPSHYVARHPDTKALAESARARVVVIPPGVEPASSFALPPEDVARASPAGRETGGFPLERVCHSGVLKKLSCCDPDCQLIGFAGRLSPEKGPGLFMAVAEALATLLPSAVFVVVGDGPLRIALEAAAERLGLARRMHFAGWVDGDDLLHLLAGMTLLLNPSLALETFSIINIQAMSVGTPVAAFGVAGMLEYITPNVNALVLDDAEPRAVAEAVADLLLDRPRLDALAERGMSDVSLNFRTEAAVERWAEVYETLR